MSHLVRKRANLSKLAQSELLSLSGLWQLLREFLVNSQLSGKLITGIELSCPNFTNSAVTDEVSQSKNISNHCLIIRLTEHECCKSPDRCENHDHMINSLILICEISRRF